MSARILLSIEVGDSIPLERIREIAAEFNAYLKAVERELRDRGRLDEGEAIVSGAPVISMGETAKDKRQGSGKWRTGKVAG